MGKRQDDQEALAKLFGIELPKTSTFYESADEISRQAEATLAYVKDASFFNSKYCLICRRLFAHTYGQVAYCSNPCRAQALEKIGVKWEWVADAETRWDYRYADPLVIPPDALEIITTLQAREQPTSEAPQAPTALPDDVLDILKGLGL